MRQTKLRSEINPVQRPASLGGEQSLEPRYLALTRRTQQCVCMINPAEEEQAYWDAAGTGTGPASIPSSRAANPAHNKIVVHMYL